MHLQRSQELFRRARLRSAAVVLVLVGLVAACTPTGGGGGPNLQQVAGPFDRVALDDLVPLAEEHGADVV